MVMHDDDDDEYDYDVVFLKWPLFFKVVLRTVETLLTIMFGRMRNCFLASWKMRLYSRSKLLNLVFLEKGKVAVHIHHHKP